MNKNTDYQIKLNLWDDNHPLEIKLSPVARKLRVLSTIEWDPQVMVPKTTYTTSEIFNLMGVNNIRFLSAEEDEDGEIFIGLNEKAILDYLGNFDLFKINNKADLLTAFTQLKNSILDESDRLQNLLAQRSSIQISEIDSGMESINLVNLMPHALTLYNNEDEAILELPMCNEPARCASSDAAIGAYKGVPVVTKKYGSAYNLPPVKPGTFYIVSKVVGASAAVQGRTDILVPHVLVKDKNGRVIGCKVFSRVLTKKEINKES